MSIRICALKGLYQLLRQNRVDRERSCAVIVATETPLRPELTGGMECCYAPFDDVTEGSGRMTDRVARKIAGFAAQAAEKYERMYICCDAGESRSAAIAAALLRWAQADDCADIWMQAKYHPNPHVYRTMCRALGIPVTEAEVCALIETNRNAFEAALQRAWAPK